MKQIKITAPDSLNEITLGQYQEFLSIENPTDEDVINVFLGLSPAVIAKIPALEVKRLTRHVSELLNTEPDFEPKFKMRGISYGFIPNLERMSYGENIDVMKYLPKEDADWADMHKAMAVLYRPIQLDRKNGYLIEPYKGTSETAKLMKEMPLGVVISSLLFFYDLANDLLNAIPSYILREVEAEKLSSENGEAITRSIHWLRETSDVLMKLRAFHFTNASPHLPMKKTKPTTKNE